MKKLFVILAGGLILFLSACEWETIVPPVIVLPDEPVSFATQVAPIFVEVGCVSCHAGATKPDFRADKSYLSLTGGGFVDTTNPANSKLVIKLNGGHPSPGKLSGEQMALLLKWIEEGAKNN